jgi:hypothetical protein
MHTTYGSLDLVFVLSGARLDDTPHIDWPLRLATLWI